MWRSYGGGQVGVVSRVSPGVVRAVDVARRQFRDGLDAALALECVEVAVDHDDRLSRVGPPAVTDKPDLDTPPYDLHMFEMIPWTAFETVGYEDQT